MKKVSSIIWVSLLASSSFLHAQKIDQTAVQRQTTPPANISLGQGRNAPTIESSDTGLLRPISLQTKNFTFFGGLDNNIAFKPNPLTLELKDDISEAGGATGIWSYTLSAGSMMNPIDFGSFMVSPVAGGSWTSSENLNDKFSSLDSYVTSAYALLMIQHESGLSFRGGSSYAHVRYADEDAGEAYSEFYPNIGASYNFDHGNDVTGTLDISGGVHLAKTDYPGTDGLNRRGVLSNWDYTLSYSLNYQFWNFLITPSYRITNKEFINDTKYVASTFQREDVLHSLSLKVLYPVIEHVNISASYSHERRNSNKASDYRSNDFSGNLGLSYSF